MLRVSSSQTGTGIDLAMVNGEDVGEVELPLARELASFAEAVASRDETALAGARERLRGAGGSAVLVDAAGVAANFQRMVRIADSTGIPVDRLDDELGNSVRAELDLYRFESAKNSVASGRVWNSSPGGS